MKRIIQFLFLITFVLVIHAQEVNKEITTYYFIRHAEKTDSKNPNPSLNMKGKLRAEKWMNVFNNVKFDLIYSTKYNRTKETALPTAENQDLDIIIYSPGKSDYDKFLGVTKGKTVLIVGHSNTVPEFVNFVIGEDKYKTIEHHNNCNLYIIEIKDKLITDKLLFIE